MQRLLLVLAVPLMLFATPQALSQSEKPYLEEIIVTATKREESIQDIPIAVTAFDAVTLERAGIKDLRDLSAVSASFNMNSTQTESQGTTMRMRGVGTTGNNIGLESSVGIFLDGVYLSRPGIALGDLLDVRQIEVLRGPQGTLFGRNTSAGAISIFTKKPSMVESEHFINISSGNKDFQNIQVGTSGPLVADTLAYRLSAAWRKQDGFLKSTTGAESRNRDRRMIRGQLLWNIGETMELRLIGDYSEADEKCCDAVIVLEAPLVALNSFLAARLPVHGGVTALGKSAFDNITGNAEQFENPFRQYGLSAEFNWDLSDTTRLTFIGSYRDFDASSVQHSDFVSLDIFSVQPSAAGGQKSFDTVETWTSELRLAGETGRLSWMVGGYYSDEDIEEGQGLGAGKDFSANIDANIYALATAAAIAAGPQPDAPTLSASEQAIAKAVGEAVGAIRLIADPDSPVTVTLADLATLSPLTPGSPSRQLYAGGLDAAGSYAQNIFKQEGTSWSIFTHNTLHVTDQLDLVLGLRWINEKKDGSFEQPFAKNPACLQTAANAAALKSAADPTNKIRMDLDARVEATARGVVIGGARLAGAAAGRAMAAGASAAVQAAAAEAGADAAAMLPATLAGATAVAAGTAKSIERGLVGANAFVPLAFGYACFPFTAPALGALIPNLPITFDRTYRDEEMAYTVKAVYDFTDGLTAYVSFTHGYKAGGFNLDATAAANGGDPRFSAETNDAWELGIKSQWFDNRLRANLAIFDYDLEDFQVLDFTGVQFNTFNVPKAESRGVEIELSATPVEGLNISFAYTRADSKYPDNCDGNDPSVSPRIKSLCGFDLTNAPKHVVTAGLGYEGQVQNYVYFLNGFYRWEDDRRTSTQPINVVNKVDVLAPFDIQKSNAKLNLRLGFGTHSGAWTVELWGNNVTDKRTKNVTFNTPLRGVASSGTASRAVFMEAPRTVGVTLRTKL